jgi:hypothetical protein
MSFPHDLCDERALLHGTTTPTQSSFRSNVSLRLEEIKKRCQDGAKKYEEAMREANLAIAQSKERVKQMEAMIIEQQTQNDQLSILKQECDALGESQKSIAEGINELSNTNDRIDTLLSITTIYYIASVSDYLCGDCGSDMQICACKCYDCGEPYDYCLCDDASCPNDFSVLYDDDPEDPNFFGSDL